MDHLLDDPCVMDALDDLQVQELLGPVLRCHDGFVGLLPLLKQIRLIPLQNIVELVPEIVEFSDHVVGAEVLLLLLLLHRERREQPPSLVVLVVGDHELEGVFPVFLHNGSGLVPRELGFLEHLGSPVGLPHLYVFHLCGSPALLVMPIVNFLCVLLDVVLAD